MSHISGNVNLRTSWRLLWTLYLQRSKIPNVPVLQERLVSVIMCCFNDEISNLYGCNDVSELNKDDDMLHTEACTSSLQTWHRKGRGDSLQPQPVIEVNVKKTKLDYNTSNSYGSESLRKNSGVQCNLFEARANLRTQVKVELNLQQDLERLHPSTALAQIMYDADHAGDQDGYVETLYSPRGSYTIRNYI
jgi:hypothetical protein